MRGDGEDVGAVVEREQRDRQDVVPVAVPLGPLSLDQVTLATATSSVAVPATGSSPSAVA